MSHCASGRRYGKVLGGCVKLSRSTNGAVVGLEDSTHPTTTENRPPRIARERGVSASLFYYNLEEISVRVRPTPSPARNGCRSRGQSDRGRIHRRSRAGSRPPRSRRQSSQTIDS